MRTEYGNGVTLSLQQVSLVLSSEGVGVDGVQMFFVSLQDILCPV